MTSDITLVITLSVIIALSPFVAKVLRIPTTPVEIILGSFAAYYHFISSHNQLFELVAEFGFIYLMFIAGTEVNIRKIFAADTKLLKKGVLYIGLLYLFSFIFATYLELSNIFILIMPLISIGLVATLAKEFGKELDWIKLSFIIGSMGEVISIILLTISSATI